MSYILCPLTGTPTRNILLPTQTSNTTGVNDVATKISGGLSLDSNVCRTLMGHHWAIRTTAWKPTQHQKWRMALLHRRPEGHEVLPSRSDQCVELQGTGSRVALQDRQPRHASGIQVGRNAAHGERHPLRDRRNAARRLCPPRRHWRTAVEI